MNKSGLMAIPKLGVPEMGVPPINRAPLSQLESINAEIDHWHHYMSPDDQDRIGVLKASAWSSLGAQYCYTLIDKIAGEFGFADFQAAEDSGFVGSEQEHDLAWLSSGFSVVSAGAYAHDRSILVAMVLKLLAGPHWRRILTEMQDESAYAIRAFGLINV